MTKATYVRMTQEFKQECERAFKKGYFDGMMDILRKYHPCGSKASTNAQVLVVSEFIRSDRNRGELVSLCTLSTSWDSRKRYVGVGFGVIPNGTMRIHAPKS